MALERRKFGYYYYQSVRIGTRVVKRYYGSGKVAVLISQYERLQAEDRKLERQWARNKAERRQRKIARVFDLLHRANRLVGEALRASGWHQHKREWRKKRGAIVSANLATVIDSWIPAEMMTKAGALDPAVMKKARAGDKAALPAVEKYLDNPAAVAFWGDSGRALLTW